MKIKELLANSVFFEMSYSIIICIIKYCLQKIISDCLFQDILTWCALPITHVLLILSTDVEQSALRN